MMVPETAWGISEWTDVMWFQVGKFMLKNTEAAVAQLPHTPWCFVCYRSPICSWEYLKMYFLSINLFSNHYYVIF